jgi:NADH-quinone oxidoreductase subunit F
MIRIPLLLTADPDAYTALDLAAAEPDRLRRILSTTTLTGRGGAHFPVARKVEALLAAPGPRVVVCNAAEDEPGSHKDRTLLTVNPHTVLAGALLAAAALDAAEVVLYLGETSDAARDSVTAALPRAQAHAHRHGLPRPRLVRAPAHYVAGEATAVVRAIDGGPARPTGTPPYPTESGVGGRPTLVANCETLANLPRLLRAGDTPPPLTVLATLTGDIAAPGVYEILPGTETFADLFARAGGVLGSLKAFQPGGPSSRFLTAAAAATPVAAEAIRAAGSQPGCLAIRVLSADRCLVEVCAEITGFFGREQCGQCPPCRMKTQTYHRTIQLVGSGAGGRDLLGKLAVVDEFVADLPRRCSLIDMPTAPVDSALTLFPDDFAAHLEHGSCRPPDHPLLHSKAEAGHGN